jgi:ribonuclease BN (tRNA processing enzyme)
MIELGFLGTGGSFSIAERDNTSFLFNTGQNLILVDTPGSVIQRIQKLGFDPFDLGTILMTHIHADHVYGLPSVFHSLMLHEGLIHVYGSEETVQFCARYLDLFGLREAKVRTQTVLHTVHPEKSFRLGDVADVRPFKVRHHSSSLAYLFHFAEGLTFLYSGDTPADSALLRRAGDFEVLCHDSSAPSRFFEQYPVLKTMHTDSAELGRLAEEAGVKTLIPIHFFGEVEFSLAEIEAEIRQSYAGRLIIPRDFDKIQL